MAPVRDSSGTVLAVGRLAGLEPLGLEAGDNNWYRFVANGPTGSTDPSGLQTPCQTLSLVTPAPETLFHKPVICTSGLTSIRTCTGPGDTVTTNVLPGTPTPGFIDRIVCWIGPARVLRCTGGVAHVPGVDPGPTYNTIVVTCQLASVAAPVGATFRVVTCGGKALRVMKESSAVVRNTRLDTIRYWIRLDRPHHQKPCHWDGVIPQTVRKWFF